MRASDVLRRVGERVAAGEGAAEAWRALLPALDDGAAGRSTA